MKALPPSPGLLRDYTPPPGHDEALLPGGGLRPGWRSLMDHIDRLGPLRLETLRQQARQLLLENGITYNVFQNDEVRELDLLPLLLAEEEWLRLEAGLKQRHRVLEGLLADLYGEQEVLKNGVLPPEVIFSHPGYQRSCHGLPRPGGALLPWWAADVIRNSHGEFQVLGDLLQSPAGSGYALENRQIMFRLLRQPLNENHVRLLLPFFTALRNHLSQASPLPKEDPHTVLLTPGPEEKLYFEHAFLANYLGLTLVQGEDLAVRGGRLHLKTLDGLHPVDVVLRMLQDTAIDPLELGEEGFLGVAGVLQAVRGQRVAVLNHPGAAVLENPALLGYFPALCRHLLGEEPRLAVTPTWWCGEPEPRARVLAELDRLVIREQGKPPRPGAALSRAEQEALRADILERPRAFIAHPPLTPSTMPVLTPQGVQPGYVVLRTFATAGKGEAEVMPGGLARVALGEDRLPSFTDQAGITKDVWVLSPHPVARTNHLPLDRLSEPSFFAGELSSRMAENLFWVGRYAERGENILRLLRVVLLLPRPEGTEGGEYEALRSLYRALTLVTASQPGFVGEGAEARLRDPEPELLTLIRAPELAGSACSSIHALILAAYRVRERLSNDTWRVVNQVRESRQRLCQQRSTADMVGEIEGLITAFAAMAGLARENMTRGLGWRFLDLGRRLERAIFAVELLHATLIHPLSPEGERILLDALLNVSDSSITYRRRYRTHLALKPFLELILMDESNPRGLASQLALIEEHAAALPRRSATPPHRTPSGRIVLETVSALRLAETDLLALAGEGGGRTNLASLLERFQGLLPLLSLELAHAFFQHASSHALGQAG